MYTYLSPGPSHLSKEKGGCFKSLIFLRYSYSQPVLGSLPLVALQQPPGLPAGEVPTPALPDWPVFQGEGSRPSAAPRQG